MAKYFIDFEFIEGFHKPLFGKRRHFIDLISVGIFCEDGREYYAISNQFQIKKTWNKYDLKLANTSKNHSMNDIRVYWIQDNVLKPMMYELWHKYGHLQNLHHISNDLTIYNLKKWIAAYGKSNEQIADEVVKFINSEPIKIDNAGGSTVTLSQYSKRVLKQGYLEPEFYGYYADYDWVLFCSLFGRMIDLPKGFPMYCKDLKQTLDEKQSDKTLMSKIGMVYGVQNIKNLPNYPKQQNEHNALSDAKWNYELYKFLQTL